MDTDLVRRWVAGFEAAAEVNRDAMRARGADPARSVTLALSLIEVARRLRRDDDTAALRERDAERVRSAWAALRARLRH
jgi:hypothetical protein